MNDHDPKTMTVPERGASVTYHVETNRMSLQSTLDAALARAVEAEAERDALKIENARLRKDARRLVYSLAKVLGIDLDEFEEWQIEQEEKSIER